MTRVSLYCARIGEKHNSQLCRHVNLLNGTYQRISGDDEETAKGWKFLFDRVMQKRLEGNKKAIFSDKQETGTTLNH